MNPVIAPRRSHLSRCSWKFKINGRAVRAFCYLKVITGRGLHSFGLVVRDVSRPGENRFGEIVVISIYFHPGALVISRLIFEETPKSEQRVISRDPALRMYTCTCMSVTSTIGEVSIIVNSVGFETIDHSALGPDQPWPASPDDARLFTRRFCIHNYTPPFAERR